MGSSVSSLICDTDWRYRAAVGAVGALEAASSQVAIRPRSIPAPSLGDYAKLSVCRYRHVRRLASTRLVILDVTDIKLEMCHGGRGVIHLGNPGRPQTCVALATAMGAVMGETLDISGMRFAKSSKSITSKSWGGLHRIRAQLVP